jgi:3alpha(or 20beta)-hydroxysteroid dehydrogenase
MSTLFDLTGKRVLVTGAANGIGRRTAELLGQAGAKVFLTDINPAGEAHASALREAGADAHFHKLDVTSEADWATGVAAAKAAFGGLDGLVNNAGFMLMAPLFDTSLEDWRRQQAVNVEGVFLGMKHAGPAMLPQGGSIVNLSSIYGIVGSQAFTAYCASKGAVRLLTKAAAIEWGRAGLALRVNSVHPGVIDTELAAEPLRVMAGIGVLPSYEAGRELVKQRHPIGRWGQPTDIAGAILFLLSDASSFMTGSELVVDGGWTAD